MMRLPYKNYRVRSGFVSASEADIHNANEIEVQVARGIVRYLEKPENAAQKAMLIDSARHERAMNSHYGVHSPQWGKARKEFTQVCVDLGDVMVPSSWIEPGDDPYLFDVALMRAVRFYLDGTFYDTHEIKVDKDAL